MRSAPVPELKLMRYKQLHWMRREVRSSQFMLWRTPDSRQSREARQAHYPFPLRHLPLVGLLHRPPLHLVPHHQDHSFPYWPPCHLVSPPRSILRFP